MTLLLANLVLTSALVGLIWTIQVVHYPLFDQVGDHGFQRYHERHAALITVVVGPLMVAELFAALALALAPPAGVTSALGWAALGLVLAVWGTTAVVQVPQHAALGHGFRADVHRRLVRGNWLRTIAWTVRAGLLFVMVEHALAAA